MKIPSVETRHLWLRGFTGDDLEPLQAILAEPGVLDYFPRTEPWPREKVEKWLKGHWAHWRDFGYGWWALEDRQKAELIGWCGLGFLEETDEIEVKYLLKKSYWGKGLASEAARQCVAYGFSELDLDMIIGLTHPDNIASQRVLEKCGLTFSNEAIYFGMACRRFTIDRRRHEQISR